MGAVADGALIVVRAGETLKRAYEEAVRSLTSTKLLGAVLNDLTERKVKVHLSGGDLDIEWASDNHVHKTGPATFVFEGEVEI